MIKSDNWIRRMAAATKMIEPFEPGQVREVDGRKIVSYGTSSYGYDIRCSREFKIFTNINSTIVDPKAFDAGSFVDFTGDVCIIPPNSFALARTVEYFRDPAQRARRFASGKSHVCAMLPRRHARCARRRYVPTLEEMARRADTRRAVLRLQHRRAWPRSSCRCSMRRAISVAIALLEVGARQWRDRRTRTPRS